MQGMWQTTHQQTPRHLTSLVDLVIPAWSCPSQPLIWHKPASPQQWECYLSLGEGGIGTAPAAGALERVEELQPPERAPRAPGGAEGWGWEHCSLQWTRTAASIPWDALWGSVRPGSVTPESWSRALPCPQAEQWGQQPPEAWYRLQLLWGSPAREGWGTPKVAVVLAMSKYAPVLGKKSLFLFWGDSKNFVKSSKAACSENTNKAENIRGSFFANTEDNKRERSRKSELLSFHWHLTALCFIRIREQNPLKMNVWHSTIHTLKKYHTNP